MVGATSLFFKYDVWYYKPFCTSYTYFHLVLKTIKQGIWKDEFYRQSFIFYVYNDLSNLHRSIPRGVGLICLLSISIIPFCASFFNISNVVFGSSSLFCLWNSSKSTCIFPLFRASLKASHSFCISCSSLWDSIVNYSTLCI